MEEHREHMKALSPFSMVAAPPEVEVKPAGSGESDRSYRYWRSKAEGAISPVERAASHTPGLFVVNLAPSELAQQVEPASFRQSKAQDLAYSVGEYYVPSPPDAPDASPKRGHYLATWENDGSGWRLLHASFPEPEGTSAQ